MRHSFRIAGAFVGLLVGAGFASGQEIMQFFTRFGFYSVAGIIAATILFILLGFFLTHIGSMLQTTSHKEVMYYLGGRHIGGLLDLLISFVLFVMGAAMYAGAGATFEQTFQIPSSVGTTIIVLLTTITLLGNAKTIIHIITFLTPYLLFIIIIIVIYSVQAMDLTFGEAHVIAQQSTTSNNWWLSALLYVSYNMTVGAAILVVMSGEVKNKHSARMGGVLGGVFLGILIFLINIALFVQIDLLQGKQLPTLVLANEIHPLIGVLMAIFLLAMMYNTAVGMFYTFTVRFLPAQHPYFKISIFFISMGAFLLSFIGFTTIVEKVYALIGYGGLLLIATIFCAPLYRASRRSV